MFNNIIRLDSVNSTNEKLKELARKDYPEWTIVIAEEQTAGKGRRGQEWISPKGKGIYLSLLIRDVKWLVNPAYASFLASVAVADTLIKDFHLPAKVKWPNDVLVNEKKIAGVLLEMVFQGIGRGFIIVGIGLNVNHNQEDLPERLIFPATSILIEKKKSVDKEKCLSSLLLNLKRWWEKSASSGIEELKQRYIQLSSFLGKEVKVVDDDLTFRGIAKGYAEDGSLILEMDKGNKIKVYNGTLYFNHSTGEKDEQV